MIIDRFLLLISIPVIVFIAAGCGGSKMINTATLPDSYQCQHMKEVCKEARTFESAYNKMSAEEKKDAENILKAYRIQCNDALEFCTESAKKK